MDIELSAKVAAVTVYTSQARVTVRGQVTLERGSQRLIVEDLPLSMEKESLRVGLQAEMHLLDLPELHSQPHV